MFKKSVPVLMILFLSGCGIAPGMKMEKPPESVQYEANKFHITPTFVPITAELIAKMPETQKDKYYYIGPQDVLGITVWDHPEFTSAGNITSSLTMDNNPVGIIDKNTSLNPITPGDGFLVNADGNIYFPLIGNVSVNGKTSDQIREELARLLSKYIRNPQVEVRVSAFRSRRVFVMGEVQKPGILNIYDVPTSITDAINLAGGLNQDTADPAQIYVIRGDIQKPTVYWLNASNADALLLGEHFRLESHDILFISTADVARWNRAISQIMPSIQTVWYTQSTIKQAGG